jgi:hypothetical protein
MPEIDTELAAALKQARKVPQRFVFVSKGANEGMLLLARKSVPTKEVSEARKKVGGGIIYRGRCGGDDGKLVFEVPKEPPATLANQLRNLIRRDAGLTLPVEVRVASDLADEEVEAQTEATPSADAAQAALLKRLSALVGPFKEAVAAKSPHVARLQTLFPEVMRLLDQKNVPGATRSLDELEKLLKQPTSPPAQPATDGKAEVLKRLNALTTAIKTALAGPDAGPVKTLVGTVNGLLKNNEFAEAGTALEELERLLKAPSESPAPGPTPSGDGGVSLVVLQQSRLAWEAARKKAQGDLAKLRKAILDDFKDEPELPHVRKFGCPAGPRAGSIR